MAITYFDTVNGEIISEYAGTTQLDYLSDALGSVTGVCDQTGSSVGSAAYAPYGATLSTSGTQASFGWNGGWGYRPTSLVNAEFYVEARHYTSTDGCWISVDPTWPKERAYGYVSSAPTCFVDPSGLDPCPGVVYQAQKQCFGIVPTGATARAAVNACIAAANKALGSNCPPITPITMGCLGRAASNRSLLDCTDQINYCGFTPNAPGTPGRAPVPVGGLPYPVGPIEINPGRHMPQCTSSGTWKTLCNPSIAPGGFPNTTTGRLAWTICHESLHACGYNHTTSGGDPPRGVPTCNDIAVCCMYNVAKGISGGCNHKTGP